MTSRLVETGVPLDVIARFDLEEPVIVYTRIDNPCITISALAYYDHWVPLSENQLTMVLRSEGNHFSSLTISVTSSKFKRWNEFCRVIQTHMPHLKKLSVPGLFTFEDQHLATLLQHVPQELDTLYLESHGHYDDRKRLSLEQVPRSLTQLKTLQLWCYCCEEENGNVEDMPRMIEQLTGLDTLEIKGEHGSVPLRGWELITNSIQAHPSLVNLTICNPREPNTLKPVRFDTATEDAILYRLAVNKTKRILQADPTPEQWIQAVIATRHNIGCLDYLLRNYDPTIYAKDAMLASRQARPLPKKRKLEAEPDERSRVFEYEEEEA